MISLRQLARLAGVSPTTVLRALRHAKDVAEPTRQRIIGLADEHDYAPLVRVKPQRTSQHPVIGCIVPNLQSQNGAILVGLLANKCMQHHCRWLLRESYSRPSCTLEALRHFADNGVDGIIMHSGHYLPLPAEIIQYLQDHQTPVVTLDVTPAECPLDWVGIDEEAVGEIAVDYLYGLGHRQMGFIGYLPRGDNSAGRPLGVQHALVRRNISLSCSIDVEFKDPVQAIAELFHAPALPTAIIAQYDLLALIAVQEARRHRLSVPSDLSIMGMGDYPFAPYTIPPLTSVAYIEHTAVARRAVDLLFSRLEHSTPTQESTVEHIAFPPHLVERASCAPPAHRR
jgi:DNA-binding LacI/PurR family transcriptional regulator